MVDQQIVIAVTLLVFTAVAIFLLQRQNREAVVRATVEATHNTDAPKTAAVEVATTIPQVPQPVVALTASAPVQISQIGSTLTYTDLFDSYIVTDPGDNRFAAKTFSANSGSVLTAAMLDECVQDPTSLGVVFTGGNFKLLVSGTRASGATWSLDGQTDPATVKSWWKAVPVAWGTPGAAYIKKRQTHVVDVPADKHMPGLVLPNLALQPVNSSAPISKAPMMPAADPSPAGPPPMSNNDFQIYVAAQAILAKPQSDATAIAWAKHVVTALQDYTLSPLQKASLKS